MQSSVLRSSSSHAFKRINVNRLGVPGPCPVAAKLNVVMAGAEVAPNVVCVLLMHGLITGAPSSRRMVRSSATNGESSSGTFSCCCCLLCKSNAYGEAAAHSHWCICMHTLQHASTDLLNSITRSSMCLSMSSAMHGCTFIARAAHWCCRLAIPGTCIRPAGLQFCTNQQH
jgi:hypothetical protein